jgi:hypothetical protein
MAQGEQKAISIHDRALHDLRYIRSTMERAGAFTAVPGRGGMLMGCVALAGALAAHVQPTAGRWLGTWLLTALLAAALGLLSMARKARRAGEALLSGAGRKFAVGFTAPMFAGAVLTVRLAATGLDALLPGIWLLLYGTGVLTAGAASVRPVRVMGAAFMALGALALLSPAPWGDAWMAVGFGAVHLVFGFHIARRHGG